MTRLIGATIGVVVAILALIFAVGLAVLTRADIPANLMLPIAGSFAVLIVLIQFSLGPVIIDMIVKIRWANTMELGPDFASWMSSTCKTFRISEPRFGIIEEAAPNAFTYGHGAYDARVVVTRGLIQMLEPEELKAVVAHELGHIKHRDFIVMTMVQALVLALYSIYIACRITNNRNMAWIVIVSYLAYWASYYASLMLSRIREYMADYASAQITQNPNALSYALVKIAYGLATTQTVKTAPATVPYPRPVPGYGPTMAASPMAAAPPRAAQGRRQAAQIILGAPAVQPPPSVPPIQASPDPISALAAGFLNKPQGNGQQRTPKNAPFSAANLGAFGVMGVASMRAAVAWTGANGLANPDTFMTAARWELFNPWAKIAEVCSTHPLTALRIQALQKLNRLWNQPNAFDFSKIQPAKYRGFLRDIFVVSLPIIGLIAGGVAGAAVFSTTLSGVHGFKELMLAVTGLFAGMFIQLVVTHHNEFQPCTVLRLLGEVQVSHVNPKPIALEGMITGRVSPGIAWASDFVVQDSSGFLVCQFREPFALLSAMFGLFQADRYVGRPVRIYGWYRRFNSPYIEVQRFEMMDTRETVRAWYFPVALVGLGLLTALSVSAVLFL